MEKCREWFRIGCWTVMIVAVIVLVVTVWWFCGGGSSGGWMNFDKVLPEMVPDLGVLWRGNFPA